MRDWQKTAEGLSYENQQLAAVVLHLAAKLGDVPLAEDAQDVIEIARAIVVDASAQTDGDGQ